MPVSKDMRMFDLYNEIEELVRSYTDDGFDKIDQSLVDVLLYGFSSATYTDVYGTAGTTSTPPDGVALFSASHTTPLNTTTYRNLIRNAAGTANPALTRESLIQARIDGRRHLDPTGHVRPINLDTLIVGPGNEDLAMRTVHSTGMSGTADNDTNPLHGKVKVLVWDRQDVRSDNTDTSAYWFMCDSRNVKDSLEVYFAERPSLDAPEQAYKSKVWNYSIDFYYTIARKFPAFVWGSTGAN